jgi:hypothetical protein
MKLISGNSLPSDVIMSRIVKSRKILILTLLIVFIGSLLVTGIRAYLYKDYEQVLKYPEETASLFISADSSVVISAYLYVENSRTLGAVINFEALPDSLMVEDLKVNVHSADKPGQSIVLKKVTAVIHPVSFTEGPELKHLEVNSFQELPVSSRTITNSSLPYNGIRFYFKARDLINTSFYNFIIEGKFIHKGRQNSFRKEIKTKRILEYNPYRMMT